jgi:RNA polymerase sigma factor (sigma-70 family)
MTKERYSAPGPEAFAGESNRPRDIAAAVSDAYWERVRLFATRQLRDRIEAEDVAQETMRVVLEALDRGSIQNLEALPGFVFQTARHLCLKRMRSQRRGEAAMARLGTSEVDPAADALASLLDDERLQHLGSIIAALAEPDRLLLQLFYVEGLGAEEVGRRLSITAVSARVRKHRLIARLSSIETGGNAEREPGTE